MIKQYLRTRIDLFFLAGHNQLDGSTTYADAVAPSSRVDLMTLYPKPVKIGTTTTDAEGALRFDHLQFNPKAEITLLAFDPAGQFDPTVKTNLIPSPMLPDPAEHQP